jgi:hypothetical protein
VDLNNLTLYNCSEIIQQIENYADAQDGVITDEQMELLVKAQTTSLDKLGKLANYVSFLESFQDAAKSEIDRLYQRKVAAAGRVESIKRFLLPYIQEHGATNAGLHRISIRKSEGIVLEDGFANPLYCEVVTTLKPDKKKIKESIKNGTEVQGAKLEQRDNVQIK